MGVEEVGLGYWEGGAKRPEMEERKPEEEEEDEAVGAGALGSTGL